MEILYLIQDASSPALDRLFEAFTLLAEQVPLAFIFCCIYWCQDKRLGRYLIVSLSLSLCVNGLLKDLVRAPRPIGQPGIVSRSTKSATGYSFPSNHAQSAASFYGALTIWPRRSAGKAVLLGLLVFGVGYSRLYLGVHYPIDVFGGWLIGLSVSFLIYLMLRLPGANILIATLCAVLAVWAILLGESKDTVASGGLALGTVLGLLLEERFVRFSPTSQPDRALGRIFGGVVLLGLLYLLPRLLLTRTVALDSAVYGLISFTATGGWPWMFTRLESSWIRRPVI